MHVNDTPLDESQSRNITKMPERLPSLTQYSQKKEKKKTITPLPTRRKTPSWSSIRELATQKCIQIMGLIAKWGSN